jgi:hypothetical protein
MASIKVTIDKETLALKAEVEGMRGVGCTTSLDEFQKMAGMVTQSQTLKPEYKHVEQRIPHKR